MSPRHGAGRAHTVRDLLVIGTLEGFAIFAAHLVIFAITGSS